LEVGTKKYQDTGEIYNIRNFPPYNAKFVEFCDDCDCCLTITCHSLISLLFIRHVSVCITGLKDHGRHKDVACRPVAT
jgi:hypothetical protein